MSAPETPYAAKTFGDRNRLKRYLQGRRLRDAVDMTRGLAKPDVIVDFGAGNGELCKLLAGHFRGSRIICFEPHPGLLEQARENLAGIPGVELTGDDSGLPVNTADLVFCLEVFEHLPERESSQARLKIKSLLRPGGHLVVGVPVETGLPALYKGVFRMIRRYGAFDARLSHVLLSVIGNPPANRPEVELMPGSRYFLEHLGFDHRALRRTLETRFRLVKQSASPLPLAGGLINPEVNYLLEYPE